MVAPQKSVFTAEKLLIREGRMPAAGKPVAAPVSHAAPVNGTAPVAAVLGGEATAALDALRADIAGLGKKLDSFINLDHTEIERIRNEVQGIADRIEQTKREIGALKHPLAREDKLTTASLELSSVVAQTEEATSKIFDGVEKIEEIAREVRTMNLDEFAQQRVAEITDVCTTIIEACSFQDLTGQRINKVVRTLSFIEERVQNMLEIWGHDEIGRTPVHEQEGLHLKDVGGVVLHGPQELEKTNSQADIDALFN